MGLECDKYRKIEREMSKILISILSDQTIPNIRFIKEKQAEIDRFVFIGTKQMQQKNKMCSHIIALNLRKSKTEQILVNPFNITSIEEILLDSNFDEQDIYLVNITGGTKPMSIACLSFFSALPNVSIYYVPIGEGFYRQIFPKVKNPQLNFSKEITLKEYFASYQLRLIGMEHQPTKPISEAENQMKKYIDSKGDIDKLPDIKNAHQLQRAEDRSYYSGGWFEEYIYWAIKQAFNLSKTQIGFKVELQNNSSKNEYDVIFLYKDYIHIVECKAYFGSNNIYQKIEKDLYKLSALDDNFGLKAQAIYITTYNIRDYSKQINKSLQNRASSLKVNSFQFDDLINNDFIKQLL